MRRWGIRKKAALLALAGCAAAVLLGMAGIGPVATIFAIFGSPSQPFDAAHVPPAPDYARADAWLAFPGRGGMERSTPPGVAAVDEATAPADVFFIHPTTYQQKDVWNVDYRVPSEFDDAVLLGQASAFNSCCRIFVPHYRQASLYALEHGRPAVALAYGDVARAFRHYIAHENGGRPFLIAAHSQGAMHAVRLLQAEILGTPLQERLVAAYVVGAYAPSDFGTIGLPVCDGPRETGCILSWNTSQTGREGTRAFQLSLIAQVAATYFDVRAGEERIALAERSLEGRREGARIAKLRLDAGVTSTVDYDQSVLLLTQAQTELADIQRSTEQARNLLEVLVGGPVAGPLPAGMALEGQVRAIAPGLPSELLANRPDILRAEHNLRAANANIGAARAAFFPRIALTGNYGFTSTALDGLFDGANRSWSYGGLFNLPIFDWGRRNAELKLSKAQAAELVAAYQRAVQEGFREVSDGLVGRRRFAEQIAAQMRTVEAQLRLARAARLRYDNGIAIYLEVLDAERNLFASQQQLLQLRSAELQNAVSLYIALGGGLVEKGEMPQSPADNAEHRQ